MLLQLASQTLQSCKKKQHPQMLSVTLNLANRQSVDKEQGKAKQEDQTCNR